MLRYGLVTLCLPMIGLLSDKCLSVSELVTVLELVAGVVSQSMVVNVNVSQVSVNARYLSMSELVTCVSVKDEINGR